MQYNLKLLNKLNALDAKVTVNYSLEHNAQKISCY